MSDPQTSLDQPSISALVDLVASAHDSGSLLISSTQLIDALLDARAEVDGAAMDAVDRGLSGCSHRSLVPTDEALAIVADVTAAGRAVGV
jgi:hypothetical protein